MRNSEPNIYGGLATIRNGYMQMQWSRVQMYLVFNTVALPLVFGSDTESGVKLVVGLIGIAVSLFFPIAIIRGHKWFTYFNDKMAELEKLDAGMGEQPRIAVLSDPVFNTITNSWFASRKVFGIVGGFLLLLWIYETARYGFQICCFSIN